MTCQRSSNPLGNPITIPEFSQARAIMVDERLNAAATAQPPTVMVVLGTLLSGMKNVGNLIPFFGPD
jgi:hypothetical protein